MGPLNCPRRMCLTYDCPRALEGVHMYVQIHEAVCTCRAQETRQSCRRHKTVCKAREDQQKKVHFTPAEEIMIRPVAFSRNYWLRRRGALKYRLLQLYYETGAPHNVQSGIL